MGKIAEALKDVLAWSKCRHEFTYWAGRPLPGKSTQAWVRKCTKCHVTETQFAEIEPRN